MYETARFIYNCWHWMFPPFPFKEKQIPEGDGWFSFKVAVGFFLQLLFVVSLCYLVSMYI